MRDTYFLVKNKFSWLFIFFQLFFYYQYLLGHPFPPVYQFLEIFCHSILPRSSILEIYLTQARLKNMLLCYHPTGSTRNVRIKKKKKKVLIPEKNSFSDKLVILGMLTLESKVHFLLFLTHNFLVACVVLTFLTYCRQRNLY